MVVDGGDADVSAEEWNAPLYARAPVKLRMS